jgi:hypothetical protein
MTPDQDAPAGRPPAPGPAPRCYICDEPLQPDAMVRCVTPLSGVAAVLGYGLVAIHVRCGG